MPTSTAWGPGLQEIAAGKAVTRNRNTSVSRYSVTIFESLNLSTLLKQQCAGSTRWIGRSLPEIGECWLRNKCSWLMLFPRWVHVSSNTRYNGFQSYSRKPRFHPHLDGRWEMSKSHCGKGCWLTVVYEGLPTASFPTMTASNACRPWCRLISHPWLTLELKPGWCMDLFSAGGGIKKYEHPLRSPGHRWYVSKILPWDSDVDVQVSESSMHFLASFYNMTTHHYKTAKLPKGRTYMLEVNPYYTKRGIDDKLNVIDARWIDTETGMFIDITTVRKNETAEAEGIKGALMCKDKHHYLVSPCGCNSGWLFTWAGPNLYCRRRIFFPWGNLCLKTHLLWFLMPIFG